MNSKIKAVSVEKFAATNGKIFDTKKEAEEYQAIKDVAGKLNESGIYWRDTSAVEVAKYLLEHFDVVEKKPV